MCRNPTGRSATLTDAVTIDSPAHDATAGSLAVPPDDVMRTPCQPCAETDIRISTEYVRG
jgi:hypothetical protein